MPTILGIDDDKNYNSFLERYLTLLGFTAFTVTTGDQGLEFSKNIRPDLIVLDCCLKKGFSSEETLRLFKSRAATKDIPVVMISGLKEGPEDELKAKQAGAALFMTKNEISDTVKDKRVFSRRLRALILGQNHGAQKSPQRGTKMWSPLMKAAGRILMIDDDTDFCDMLSLVLRGKGYEITTVDKGVLGLSRAQQELPDLIVLDLSLPDMDGLEVCSQLKASPRTRPIPILVVTARASTQAQLLAVEYSADHYFTKPILDLDEFHNWVSAFLRRRSHLGEPGVIRVGAELVVDTATHTVTIGGKRIEKMPNVLFRLLCEFARRPGEILERSYLVERVWSKRVREHNVDTNISRLKGFLGDRAQDWFISVPGQGYRMFLFPSTDGKKVFPA